MKRTVVAVATAARVAVAGVLLILVTLAVGGTAAVAQVTTTTPTSSTIPDVCDPPPDAPDDPIPDACTANRQLPAPAPNPPLAAGCGLNVMLVVDSSGSIHDAGAEPAVTAALNAFIGALNDTGSDLGLIDFDTTAAVVSTLTPLSTASGSFAFFTDYANNFTGDGRTNWDDALFKAINSGADLTLFITDGEPNEYTQPFHSGHTGTPSSGERPLSFAVDHANTIKGSGSRMFVVGVGNATNHTTEIKAVSGTNGPGLNVAVNDFSLTSNFNDLAASLRALVFSLCQSSMTVTKLVDGQPANGWGVTATITSVTGAPGFDWRSPPQAATPPASRTRSTAGAGTATFEWVIGSEAAPLPGSVEMTIDETAQTGFQFTGGTCNIESATRTTQDVVITTLPFNIGTIPFDAIVRCTLNNQTIPTTTPTTPTTTPTTTPATSSPTSVPTSETTTTASAVEPAATGTLPPTGSGGDPPAVVAAGLMAVAGIALVYFGRRRQRA